ncbi:hypothetical protein FRB99_007373 [Tulasnella sp. 403]|nr:hypothetical protein FRB99_007373 [Tulasnella sp. 403]
MAQTNTPGAEGFLLITIQNARLSAPFCRPAEQTGLLALECVTIPLVLRVNQFELPLSATETIRHSRLNRTFTFKAPEGLVMVLLAQYGIPQETDPPKAGSGDDRDLKGRFVLVDEDDGEVVGTLGEQFSIREAQNVAENDKAPVIIDIPEEGQHTIYVQSINPEEQDFILKSAQFVSRGLILATDMIGKGMGIAADYYVKNTTPNAEPMDFSETSKDKMRRIHNISGKAVQVSAKTARLIHGLVDFSRCWSSRMPIPTP